MGALKNSTTKKKRGGKNGWVARETEENGLRGGDDVEGKRPVSKGGEEKGNNYSICVR